jgi:hypothetical protein
MTNAINAIDFDTLCKLVVIGYAGYAVVAYRVSGWVFEKLGW